MFEEEKNNNQEELEVLNEGGGKFREVFVCQKNKDGKLVCRTEVPHSHPEFSFEVKKPNIERKGKNIFINTLNVFGAPAKKIAAPIKKLAAPVKKLAKPAAMVCRPIGKGAKMICYPAIKPLHKRYKKKYHRIYALPKMVFTLDTAIIFSLIGLALLLAYAYWFQPFGLFTISHKADLSINFSREKIISGETVEFNIFYHNKSDKILEKANFNLRSPKGFQILSVIPEKAFDKVKNSFALGDLPPGANGNLKITARLIENIGSMKELWGVLNYNIGSREGKEVVRSGYTAEKSLLGADIDVADTVIKGQPYNFNIVYYNNSDSEFKDIVIKPNWPEGFHLIKSSLPLDPLDQSWHLAEVKPNSRGQLELFSIFDGSTESIHLQVDTFINFNNENFLQKRDDKILAVVNPHFIVSQSWDKKNSNVSLGEKINYAITYQNNGGYSLRNVVLKFIPTNDFVVLDSASLGKIKEDVLVFDYTIKPELALLKPGAGGEIDFSLDTKNFIDSKTVIKESPVIKSSIVAEYILEDKIEREVSQRSSEKEQKINTNLNLNAFIRYYAGSGEQLGRGPLPPEVGYATKYWIFWYPLNNLSDVSEAVISAKLGKGVEPTGLSLPLGFVEYDPESRTVSWKVGRINKYSGHPGKGLSFEVAFTPGVDQVGMVPDLLKNIRITGIDEFTGERVTRSLGSLTTNLLNDNFAKDSGRVVRSEL